MACAPYTVAGEAFEEDSQERTESKKLFFLQEHGSFGRRNFSGNILEDRQDINMWRVLTLLLGKPGIRDKVQKLLPQVRNTLFMYFTYIQITPILSFFPSFSLSGVLCDPTNLIWRIGAPFGTLTGHIAPSSDDLLAEVFSGIFLSCKANTRRSVHSLWDHFIITLIISDRRD